MKKKIISTLIAVAMVCTMLPAAAFAAGEQWNFTTGHSSLDSAGFEAPSGGTGLVIYDEPHELGYASGYNLTATDATGAVTGNLGATHVQSMADHDNGAGTGAGDKASFALYGTVTGIATAVDRVKVTRYWDDSSTSYSTDTYNSADYFKYGSTTAYFKLGNFFTEKDADGTWYRIGDKLKLTIELLDSSNAAQATADYTIDFSGVTGIVKKTATPPSPSTYTVGGTITDANGGAGLAATLQLKDQNGNAVGAAATAAANGEYTISNVPDGEDYTIAVTMAGYQPGTIVAFNVDGQNVTGKNLTLTKNATAESGYTTDSNGIMSYQYTSDGCFDIHGLYNNTWVGTTFANEGYDTLVKTGDSMATVTADGNANAVGVTGLTADVDLSHTADGKHIVVTYTIKNTSATPITYSLASGADVEIAGDDEAVVTDFFGNYGFKMVADSGAQFNFFGRGGAPITNVDAYWHGDYDDYDSDQFFAKESDIDPSFTGDSAMTYSWQNKTIAAGAAQTFAVKIGIGGEGSESDGLPKFDVKGTVTAEAGATPISSATVKLMQGSTVVKTFTTSTDGKYGFDDVVVGVYNIVVEASGKTITKGVVVAEEKTIDFTIPTGNQNTEVVVKPSTPDTSVEGLEDMFTAEDNTAAQTQKVEIKLEAETKVANDLLPDDVTKIDVAKGNNTIGMYLDLQLLKTVGITPAVTIQPPQGKLLKITIALPPQLQGMLNYSIIRIHGAEVATFPATYDTIAKTLTFSADKFSTYAVVYNNNNNPAPSNPSGGYWYGGWAGSSDITVSFNSNGGSYINPVKLSNGSTIDPYKYIPTKSGYAFGGWYTDSGLTKLVTANTRFNSNTTIYVRWLEESVTAPVTPSAPSTGATSNPQTGDSWFANLFA